MTRIDKIRMALQAALAPQQLDIEDESHLHAGHAGDNGTGESHFHVKVVSSELSKMSRVEGQRRVYDILASELKTTIHALSINILKD